MDNISIIALEKIRKDKPRRLKLIWREWTSAIYIHFHLLQLRFYDNINTNYYISC